MTADNALADYYALRAPEYDRLYAKPERQADLAMLRARVGEWARGRRVLELACGTGWWTQFLAPVAESVTAVDINSEVLEIAARRVPQPAVRWLCRDLYSAEPIESESQSWPDRLVEPQIYADEPRFKRTPSATTRQGICGNLRQSAEETRNPANPRGFNSGFAAFWWSHVPRNRVEEFLAKFHRQLVPGATVMLLDNRYVPGSSTPISRTDAEGNTYQTRRLDSGKTYEVLKNFPEPSELQRVLEPFGAEVKVELLEYYWRATYRTNGGVA